MGTIDERRGSGVGYGWGVGALDDAGVERTYGDVAIKDPEADELDEETDGARVEIDDRRLRTSPPLSSSSGSHGKGFVDL